LGAAAAGLAAMGQVPAAASAPAEAPSPPPSPPAPPLPDPVPRELHLARLQVARERMALVKVTHLIEVPGPGLACLAGLPLERSERFAGLVVPASGPPVILCHAADRGIVMAGPVPFEEPIFYDESEEPIRMLGKVLKRGDASLVALSGRIWYEEFAPLHADLPKLTFASSHPFSEDQRHVKSTEELRLIEAAARIVQESVEPVLRGIREGMTEMEVAGSVIEAVRARGAHAEGSVVSGPRSAVPRLPTSDRRIAAGDPVIVSFGARVHGYWARVSRTVVVGRATGRMKLIHQTLRDAQGFGIERARPGTPAAAVDQIVRATLGGRGFLKQAPQGSGAGCGLEPVEPPFLSPGYLEPLAAGHVFTLGQGVYTGEEYGIRQHDTLVVTSDGARWLTRPAGELPEL
jgi:Xaa-Pro dipeptidase